MKDISFQNQAFLKNKESFVKESGVYEKHLILIITNIYNKIVKNIFLIQTKSHVFLRLLLSFNLKIHYLINPYLIQLSHKIRKDSPENGSRC